VRDDAPEASAQLQVNAEAPQRLVRLLAGRLPEGIHGASVHLLDGTFFPPAFSLYAQSKAALAASVGQDALELAPQLRLNAICPGPSLINPRESKAHFEELVRATPLRTSSSPEDIAFAVRFLLGIKTMTGAVLPLDGGLHLVKSPLESQK
jgi:NAD(P)-dependent dehydrogenase (short-subunit alcohol dehydrogenase family)